MLISKKDRKTDQQEKLRKQRAGIFWKRITRGAVLLQITGREEVYIENFRGILEYTDCGILILGKQGRILIEGRYLQIPFYTSEEMKITGQIDQIRYL